MKNIPSIKRGQRLQQNTVQWESFDTPNLVDLDGF